MSIRIGFVLAAAMASAAAHASYDLLLMADNNVDFVNAKFAKIHRYDPVSGAYLGSVGSYSTSIMGLAADKATGLCYVQLSGNLITIDYSTGQSGSLNASGALGITLANDGKTVYQYLSTSLRAISTTTGALTNSVALGYTAGGVTMSKNGFLLVYDKTNGMLKSYNATTLALASSAVLPAITTFGGMCVEPSTGRAVLTSVIGGTVTITRYTVSALGNLTVAPGTGFNSLYVNSAGPCAPQHDGIYFLGNHPVAGARVYGFTSSDTQTTFMPYSQVVTAGPICTVLAPEPGTWAALGLGALILLRRRK